ncbi:MAG: hypothetical protein GY810_31715 [Aureispira sp.]|nr:hypothetical protein [Aureispira sp.]
MLDKHQNDLRVAIRSGDYEQVEALLNLILPHYTLEGQEIIRKGVAQAMAGAPLVVEEPDASSALSTQSLSQDSSQNDDDKDKADLTGVDWGSITGATLGGVAAIINAANGTTPDNSTINTTNNNSKEEEKETPIALYIGGGVGLILLVFIFLLLMNKKAK